MSIYLNKVQTLHLVVIANEFLIIWNFDLSLKKFFISVFPLWLSGLRTQRSSMRVLGLIPDLTQWVKHLALLQAVV